MDRFRKEMLVADALDAHPNAGAVLLRLGYRCVEKDDWCVVAEKDSLERAAEMHGKALDELLNALNALPPAPPEPGSPAVPAPAKPAEGAP
jgi:hybrid cluster-associated redox disulfide protein